MDDGLLMLRLHGLDMRNGRIPTEAFTGMIRRFAATMAIFERAFTGRRSRSMDLNVATLGRENPLVVGLRPEPRVRGYAPSPAILWTFEEIERIGQGHPPDPRVPLEALDNLVSLSDAGDGDREEVAGFFATFGAYRIGFDERLARAAKAQRGEILARQPAPTWFSGVSKGVMLGELRGVTDMQGERNFFIKTVAGDRSVRCIFPEIMRDKMNRLLFRPVKIDGYLHYDGASPHAYLLEAENISDLNEDDRPHLFDRIGLFEESYYPAAPEFPQ